jgi:ectoine hydroxylase-related dioxygenase (phytanoyl-CoA dioxygenase family)
MNAEQKYFFDLNGFTVVRGVFSAEEIAAANKVIDGKMDQVKVRKGLLRNTVQGTLMAGDGKSGRMDLGGILEWGDESAFFRSVLSHPKLIPYFHALLGKGYRMDHLPFVLAQEKGSEGFALHGGMVDVTSGKYSPHTSYHCVNGELSNTLLACSVALVDHNPGDGGYCVVRGSHKSNFPAPASFINGDSHHEFLHTPNAKAGDVILFSEATVHGALPWNGDHQRRVALYRFASATCTYGRSYFAQVGRRTHFTRLNSFKHAFYFILFYS